MNWEFVREADGSQASETALIPIRPRCHSYSASLISKAIELVLYANNSFRGAARSLEVLCGEVGNACPSFSSVRNWVLRLGLYELERPKPLGDDWALILDHTIQIGPHKALLVLGVQLSELAGRDFCLAHQDVAVLGLEVCERSNGLKVLESLERIKEQVGEPRLLISDAGSDIKKAAELFCEKHTQTDWIPDVGHRMARLLEAELKEDPHWQSFLRQAALCRSRCQQTPLSPLMPPVQRTKARWMNLKPLITWGLDVIQNPAPEWAPPSELKRIFGWLDDFEEELSEFWMMMHMGEETCRIIKLGGIDSEQLENCHEMLEEFSHGRRLRRHAEGIQQYLKEIQSKLRPGDRLLGSSDIIESIFGKYKYLVERSPEQAISRLILAIGAVTSARTPEVIHEAMERVSMESVEQWFSKYIAQSACSLRRKAFAQSGAILA
jgi:hypothetical protein